MFARSTMTTKNDHCTHIKRCQMYDLFELDDSIEVWKILYCRGTYTRCERFKLAEAGETVMPNLLPNGQTLEV